MVGKGFTEWTNVVKARPRVPEHYQLHLPADLGFYDLRLPEARAAQAELVAGYGIYGFCYYHYWFHGRQLLEPPSIHTRFAAFARPLAATARRKVQRPRGRGSPARPSNYTTSLASVIRVLGCGF